MSDNAVVSATSYSSKFYGYQYFESALLICPDQSVPSEVFSLRLAIGDLVMDLRITKSSFVVLCGSTVSESSTEKFFLFLL